MQKKIIALAIAGLSSAAFAQSTVTLSGLVDGGYYSLSMQTATIMDTKTAFAANGSATSALFITVTEDLGGGMNAKFFGETDWAPGTNAGTGLLNSYNYLELSGKFGSVKGGNLNTAALYATIAAQPFGTGIGSGISGAFGRLSRAGSNGVLTAIAGTANLVATEGENPFGASTTAGIAGARSVRVNNSLSYTSPSFSGFTAGLQWAKKNDDSSIATTGNSPGFLALNAAYNNGPINVHFVNEQTSSTAGGAPATGIAGAALGANEKITHNILAGNYTMGPATLYAGWSSSKSSGVAVETANSRSWNLGLKYAVSGALSIAGQVLKVDDKLVGNQDRNLNALGVDYAMSKRTTAYGRYEQGDNDKAASATGGFSRYQVGLRHSF